MWLLHARTYELEYFEGENIPKYAILSHRWGKEEVSFQDVMSNENRHKQGWRKIEFCCRQALLESVASERPKQRNSRTEADPRAGSGVNSGSSRRRGLLYVWVDTCCINKESSAELSEAINSMYHWYEQSEVCYAFLEDVSGTTLSKHKPSVWFSRGWTLQELLAPTEVRFYNNDWRALGTKAENASLISDITDIPKEALEGPFGRRRFCVAEKMSWASWRRTTRIEDEAYCLIGLFGVSMPLLYGERDRAFRRLQEEILRTSEDPTIFAWNHNVGFSHRHIFARTPKDFHNQAGRIETFRQNSRKRYRAEKNDIQRKYDVVVEDGVTGGCTISSAGIDISLCLVPYSQHCYFVPLFCSRILSNTSKLKGMFLWHELETGVWHRMSSNGFIVFEAPPAPLFGQMRRVLLGFGLRQAQRFNGTYKDIPYGFSVEGIEDTESDFIVDTKFTFLSRAAPADSRTPQLVMHPGTSGIAGLICIERHNRPFICLAMGFDFDFGILCLAMQLEKGSTPTDLRLHLPLFQCVSLHDETGLIVKSDDIEVTIEAVMGIIESIQANDRRTFNLRDDKVELHHLPHHLFGGHPEARRFRVTGVGTVNVNHFFNEIWLTLHEDHVQSTIVVLDSSVSKQRLDVSNWHVRTARVGSQGG